MRIKKADLDLLDSIHTFLSHRGELELANPLGGLLDRLIKQQKTERMANKDRAALNRAGGYVWKSSYHPKKSKYIEDKPLMQRLLDAGYPKEDMDHHESDLYVYVTPLTTQVVEAWCEEHKYSRTWHCPIFIDQITGRPMYDCAFQYYKEENEDVHYQR